jgi:hypothetical protein
MKNLKREVERAGKYGVKLECHRQLLIKTPDKPPHDPTTKIISKKSSGYRRRNT